MTAPHTSVLDDTSRAIGALFWQLYQHQHPADPIGRLVRQTLNIAPDATMTEAQIAAARRYGESIAHPPSATLTPPAEAVAPRAGSLWAMITGPLQNHIHRTTDEPNTAADWRGAGHNVVEYVPRASAAPVEAVQATPEGWIFMRHPTHNGGEWMPVRRFVVDGVDCYQHWDTDALELEWDERDSAWEMLAAPASPSHPDDAAVDRAWQRFQSAVGAPVLSARYRRHLERFAECCEDDDADGHDVPKDDMKFLARFGAVRSVGFGRYETTMLGDWLLGNVAPADPVQGVAMQQLVERHAAELESNPYAYFELAYTRRTEWMAWVCSRCIDDDSNRKVIAQGQGGTPEEACRRAIESLAPVSADTPADEGKTA